MAEFALSIVIPAFNEAHRLGTTLERLRQYARQRGEAWEVVVVDDGSTDATGDVARGFSSAPLTVQLLVNPANRGKGHAVARGMLAASAEVLLMSDADLSTPIEELERLRAWLDRGHDVAIGSRDMPDSQLDPPQPLLRRWMAAVFRGLRRRLMLPAVRDTQCGFKLFRREAARAVFARQTIGGWLFDCEVLGLAERMGYRVKEVGVVWQHHPHSRVSVLREALTALPTLLAIRRRLKHVERGARRGDTAP